MCEMYNAIGSTLEALSKQRPPSPRASVKHAASYDRNYKDLERVVAANSTGTSKRSGFEQINRDKIGRGGEVLPLFGRHFLLQPRKLSQARGVVENSKKDNKILLLVLCS